jgi:NhaC family Na+:H+ antiporter
MKEKSPSLQAALIPIAFLIVLLSYNVVFVYKDDALGGSNQMVLLLSAAVAAIVAVQQGVRWDHLVAGISKAVRSVVPSVIILLFIGSLAGTWLLSGVIPTMMYYGLDILHPSYFLVATVLICALVSLATGSSWSTIATVGIALLGIGQAMGIPVGMTAGAIISGAYFGDKISPMSDTTNLAPAMAGTDLFTHIRYMMYTTVPSLIITLIIFLFIGLSYRGSLSAEDVDLFQHAIEEKFVITPWLFLVPALIIYLIIRKFPALPALLMGTLFGGLFALIFQPHLIAEIGGSGSAFRQAYVALMDAMTTDIAIVTSNETVNELLTTGGMAGMMNTIWLIICAMAFGGVMESSGFLNVVAARIIRTAHSVPGLVGSTAGTCLFMNVTASDQYLAIVVPGRMYADVYKQRGLKPELLSRTLEDSGTVTSVLIPWNSCGATQSAVLGVSAFAFAPFCFFNIISPFMTWFMARINFRIRRLDPQEVEVKSA